MSWPGSTRWTGRASWTIWRGWRTRRSSGTASACGAWEKGVNTNTGYGRFATSNGLIGALEQVRSRHVLLTIHGKVDTVRYPIKDEDKDADENIWRNWGSLRFNMTREELIERLAHDPALNPRGISDPYLPAVLEDLTAIPWTEVWSIQVRPSSRE